FADQGATPRKASAGWVLSPSPRASWESGSFENAQRPEDEDEQYCTGDGDDKPYDQTAFGKAQHAGDPEAEPGTDDTYQHVGNDAHLGVGFHDDAGQPANDTANDQGYDPAHCQSPSFES